MKIIAIRHGETASNIRGQLIGWRDEQLTSKGRYEALELADRLTVGFDVVLTSPLIRALETAKILASRHPCEIMIDPDLRERNFGSLSGRTWADIGGELGTDLQRYDQESSYDYRPYGGESVHEVRTRVCRFVNSVCAFGSKKSVIAVTHGGIIKLLYSILESDIREPITNCSVHFFRSPIHGCDLARC